jgi:manganese transport protein
MSSGMFRPHGSGDTLACEGPLPRPSGPPPPAARPFSLRRLLGFLGPGYLIAVGYMDPGNWATDLAGGSTYGYALLWIVMLSSAMAMFLQVLAARLGIVTGLDLAQACRVHSRPGTVVWQWVLCEIAICAADLAEVIGTAIALKLLFGLPLAWGVSLTVLDVLLVLWLQQRGFRYLEALVISLISIVVVCLGITVAMAQPQWQAVFAGFIPTSRTVIDPGMLYIAIGIIGATVMPHNLYLHSSVVKSRPADPGAGGKKVTITYATIDIVAALALAFVINASILVMAGAAFHANGQFQVAELEDAHGLLAVMTGTTIAGTTFALALLASGQSSAVTATLAGQIVMEGFLQLRIPPWVRRILTRAVAIVPALFVTLVYGEAAIAKLLIASQVVLSLQLPFAIVPLIRYTSSRSIMGGFANGPKTAIVATLIATTIIVLNLVLIWRTLV